MTRVLTFQAQWDDEAKVWWAFCTTAEGIVTESATLAGLRERLDVIVPDFLEVGDEPTEDIQIEIVAVTGVTPPMTS